MKLTKSQLKEQKEIIKLLDKEKLSHSETELFYYQFNEGFIGDVTQHSAYFTPLDMAYDFALMSVPTCNVIVDMCAGIGHLTWAKYVRESHNNNDEKSKFICIERNPEYIKIGKKLCPFAHWYEGDMFDVELWNRIKNEHGEIGCIMSNPPFGSVSKTDVDRSWLKYKGSEIDMAAIEIGMTLAKHCAFILPQGSCTYQYSGRPYYQECENRKVKRLEKDLGYEIYMYCDSVDTTVYEGGFKNTKIVTECCSIYKKEDVM